MKTTRRIMHNEKKYKMISKRVFRERAGELPEEALDMPWGKSFSCEIKLHDSISVLNRNPIQICWIVHCQRADYVENATKHKSQPKHTMWKPIFDNRIAICKACRNGYHGGWIDENCVTIVVPVKSAHLQSRNLVGRALMKIVAIWSYVKTLFSGESKRLVLCKRKTVPVSLRKRGTCRFMYRK